MIGIVTPYKVNNYGTKLQAYAMQKIFEMYGGSEIVNFLTRSDTRLSALTGKMFSIDIWTHKALEKMKNHKVKKNKELYENLMKRNKAINSFDDSYLKKSEYVEGNAALLRLVSKYECIVCGSDQLWAPRNVIADYFTLSWVPKEIKKMSFSSSFGISSIPKHLKNKYIKYLLSFDAISVRENAGKKIIYDLLGKDVTVTLDPTLMVDANEWRVLAEKGNNTINEKYVFCYFLGTNPMHRQWAKELAKKMNCKVVILPHFIDYCESDSKIADYELYDVTPNDFLSLIYSAECVLTDSFHASVFSTLFHKRLAIFERFDSNQSQSTNSRIHSLIHNLGLESELIDNNRTVDEFLESQLDYTLVDKNLIELQKDSREYITKSLGKA